VGQEDDVIVSVGEALREELLGGETVLDRRWSEVHWGCRKEGSARVYRFRYLKKERK